MTTAERAYGVLLMTYGSPASVDDVRRYMTAVRGGRDPGDELVAEFERRYRVIGGSPLVAIAQAQAAALEQRLGRGARVRAGMRFSAPLIADALLELRDEGAREVVAIVLSPQFSSLLMGGYGRALDEARAALVGEAPQVRPAGAWHTQPAFIEALARRIASTRGDGEHVLLTAHSLPRRVAEQEPGYIEQLRETAVGVAERVGLADGEWTFCWQSAGHEPGEWMKPDFADLMPALSAGGHRSVVVAPVQFLADHLEILYDIDVGARQQAAAAGLRFSRIDSLNTDAGLIDALASVVDGTRTLDHPRASSAAH
jgi:ferrochelatase